MSSAHEDPILLSVVVPVFDGERFLEEALRSVLAQTHRELELIVVDDGSTDRSAEIVRGVARTDSRVRLVSHSRNLGVGMARRTGVLESRADWIQMFDSDDRMLPDCLETQLRVLAANPDARVVCGRSYYIGEDGRRIGASAPVRLTPQLVREMVEECRPLALLQGLALFHRSTVLEVGNYADMPAQEDTDLFTRLAERGHSIVTHESFLFEYRFHPHSSMAKAGSLSLYRFLWLETRMKARARGQPEPDWQQFLFDLRKLPLLERFNHWRMSMKLALYRQAGMLRGQRNWPGVTWRLVVVGLLGPVFLLSRLWGHVSRK